MSRDYQLTHENLLTCAKQHFLDKGFEHASIREICKDANVTNGAFYNHFSDKEALFGALVSPVVEDIKKMYDDSVQQHIKLIDTDDLKSMWQLSESTIVRVIEYAYNHFDLFQLLLMCSEGTKYVDFLDNVVRLEVRESIKLFEELKLRGVLVRDIDEEEWHILVHAYYSSLAEVVMHNYSKQSALKYVHTLADFFSVGWQKVLGI